MVPKRALELSKNWVEAGGKITFKPDMFQSQCVWSFPRRTLKYIKFSLKGLYIKWWKSEKCVLAHQGRRVHR